MRQEMSGMLGSCRVWEAEARCATLEVTAARAIEGETLLRTSTEAAKEQAMVADSDRLATPVVTRLHRFKD